MQSVLNYDFLDVSLADNPTSQTVYGVSLSELSVGLDRLYGSSKTTHYYAQPDGSKDYWYQGDNSPGI